MRCLNSMVLSLSLLSGCVVYAVDPDGSGPDTSPPVSATDPEFTYADAGCYWDPAYVDYVVYFDTDVADGAAGDDTRVVYADVFDDRTGAWVDGFDLYQEQGVTWYSAWVGSSTWVDCGDPALSVDLTAETYGGGFEVVTVPLLLY